MTVCHVMGGLSIVEKRMIFSRVSLLMIPKMEVFKVMAMSNGANHVQAQGTEYPPPPD